ncbi:MAG: DUF4231 domain-containing protein [Chthoniobacteraceae bacterium]
MSEPLLPASGFDYPERRLESQRRWHSGKATWNKRRFYTTEVVTMLAGATIPIVNVWGVQDSAEVRVASTILGAMVVLSAGIARLFKFQENWLQFRAVAESLEREREFHAQQVADYALDDEAKRHALLVERVEALLATTTAQFLASHRPATAAKPAETEGG